MNSVPKPRILIYGFTGTQNGMTRAQKIAVRDMLRDNPHEFHHGDCIGSDAEAHDIAKGFGMWVVIHPPSDPKKRAFCKGDLILPTKPYLIRNHDIVDDCHKLIATPKEEEETLRSGTWATIRYARRVQRDYCIILPSGDRLRPSRGVSGRIAEGF